MATGATVLQGAVVRPGAIVAVGALVHANAVVPKDYFVPPNAVAIGDPISILSPSEKEELVRAIRSLGFASIAFGIESGHGDRASVMKQITEVRSKEFEGHFADEVL